MKRQKDASMVTLYATLVATTFFSGGYYELAAALASLLLTVFLMLHCAGRKQMELHMNDALIMAVGIPMGYGLSIIWAVDRGLAVWGLVKYYPLILFAACCIFAGKEERDKLLRWLPYAGAVMVILSLLLSTVSFLKSQLLVAGRMAGFFFYPNTFAAFLGVGFLITFSDLLQEFTELASIRRKSVQTKVITLIILIFGQVQAASRGEIIMVFVAILAIMVRESVRNQKKTKNHSIWLWLAMIIAGICSVAIVYVAGKRNLLEHLASNILTSSTLWGRLLYWKDALRIIIGTPLGLGYQGYLFVQGEMQTGVYSVRSVHNGLLQIALDIGWLPLLLLFIALWHAFISKNNSFTKKTILIFLVAHSCFDMDMDFITIWFILFLLLDWEEHKKINLPIRKGMAAIMGLFVVGSLYVGIASMIFYAGNEETSLSVYPWNTLARINVIDSADPAVQNANADRILQQNQHVSIAWAAKANYSLSQGEITDYIRYKEHSLELERYNLDGYIDYFTQMRTIYQLYLGQQDTASASYCMDRIVSIQDTLDAIRKSTDDFAWRINDKPQLEMPKAYDAFVQEHSR